VIHSVKSLTLILVILKYLEVLPLQTLLKDRPVWETMHIYQRRLTKLTGHLPRPSPDIFRKNKTEKKRRNYSRYQLGYWIRHGRAGLDSRRRQEIFLYSTAFRPALGPTQPLSPWREADYPPPSNAEVKNGGAVPPLCKTTSWHCLIN
jgi:hypothetical protein